MRYGIILFIFALVSTAHGATINVPTDQPTIQAGIDVAVNGDTVIVAPGIYFENIDFLGKAITVESSDGPNVTAIDGRNPSDPDYGSCVYFKSGEGLDSVLNGFTVKNGTGTKVSSYERHGGGVYCKGSSPTITSNTITVNTANMQGGGGGIYCYVCEPIIEGNVITGNIAGSRGGGVYCQGPNPTVKNNLIVGNTAQEGGGVWCHNNDAIIKGNVIMENTAVHGGGIWCQTGSSPNIEENTIIKNIAESGGGICCITSSPIITNSILSSNEAPKGPEICIGDHVYSATVTISYSDVKGGQGSVYIAPGSTLNWGAGMIDADPLFVDAGDFHLTWNSPCKDIGDNSAALDLLDIEGDPRIAYGTVDMGADEFYRHLYFTGNAWPGGDVELKFVDAPWTQIQGLILGVDIYNPPIPGG